MKARAPCLFVAFVMTVAPITTVRAQERSQERTGTPLILWRAEAPLASTELLPIRPPPLLLAPSSLQRVLDSESMTDIRLSKGAKTAIIVTAIVVGVLIIVGVVVVGRGRHL